MSKPFHFKQFDILQERSAMKIGTDGVLLGAWANIEDASTILDIGTGTGVIAIMAAQRQQTANITAIEIDQAAFEEATTNASHSPWSDRITVVHSSLQDFDAHHSFDHVICNPPFFVESQLTNPNKPRSFARQDIALPLSVLIQKSKQQIKANGAISLVYPFDRFDQLRESFISQGFCLTRKMVTYGRPGIPPKRVFSEWKLTEEVIQFQELIIEEFGRHKYSEAFKYLTKDFYLNM